MAVFGACLSRPDVFKQILSLSLSLAIYIQIGDYVYIINIYTYIYIPIYHRRIHRSQDVRNPERIPGREARIVGRPRRWLAIGYPVTIHFPLVCFFNLSKGWQKITHNARQASFTVPLAMLVHGLPAARARKSVAKKLHEDFAAALEADFASYAFGRSENRFVEG